MFAHILIAYDGSELAEKALDLGLQLAGKHGSAVTILTSTEPIETGLGTGGFGTFEAKSIIEKLEIGYSAAATGTLEAARNKAAATGITAESLYVGNKRASNAILDAIDKLGIDLIIMGSHGRRGLQRLLLGSQASAVLEASKAPVLIVK